MADRKDSLNDKVLKKLNKLKMVGVIDFQESLGYRGYIDVEVCSTQDNELDYRWLGNIVGNITVNIKEGTKDIQLYLPECKGEVNLKGSNVSFDILNIESASYINFKGLSGACFGRYIKVKSRDNVEIYKCTFKDTNIYAYSLKHGMCIDLMIRGKSEGNISLIEVGTDTRNIDTWGRVIIEGSNYRSISALRVTENTNHPEEYYLKGTERKSNCTNKTFTGESYGICGYSAYMKYIEGIYEIAINSEEEVKTRGYKEDKVINLFANMKWSGSSEELMEYENIHNIKFDRIEMLIVLGNKFNCFEYSTVYQYPLEAQYKYSCDKVVITLYYTENKIYMVNDESYIVDSKGNSIETVVFIGKILKNILDDRCRVINNFKIY